jgi:uncharacterized lipoprotein
MILLRVVHKRTDTLLDVLQMSKTALARLLGARLRTQGGATVGAVDGRDDEESTPTEIEGKIVLTRTDFDVFWPRLPKRTPADVQGTPRH